MPKFVIPSFVLLVPAFLIGCSHDTETVKYPSFTTRAAEVVPTCATDEVRDAHELEGILTQMREKFARIETRSTEEAQIEATAKTVEFKKKLAKFKAKYGRSTCVAYEGGERMEMNKVAFYDQVDKAERDLIASSTGCPAGFSENYAAYIGALKAQQAELARTKSRADVEAVLNTIKGFYGTYAPQTSCVFQDADGVIMEFKAEKLKADIERLQKALDRPESDTPRKTLTSI